MELSATRDATSVRSLDNFPAFHGTRRFNTDFTSTCSYPEPDQSSPHHPHPTSSRSILILCTNLRLGLPSGLFPSGFLTNNLYAFLFSPIHATWHTHLILLDLIILIILDEEYKSRSFSLWKYVLASQGAIWSMECFRLWRKYNYLLQWTDLQPITFLILSQRWCSLNVVILK
jgi:hypothetical protein